jgi:hypothetical protein
VIPTVTRWPCESLSDSDPDRRPGRLQVASATGNRDCDGAKLQVDGEAMYQNFLRVVESVNVIIATYETQDMGETLQIDP